MSPKSRLRESAATLVAIGAVLMLTSGFTVASVTYLSQQGTRGIQTELSQRAGADLALRASLTQASNPGKQDQQVRAAVATTFADAHLDVAVTRTLALHVTVHPVTGLPDESDRGGSAQSYPDFADRAELIEGAAPVAGTDVAVQADAAKQLGLVVGQDVLVAGVRFTVSGLWRAKDLLDPRWYSDPMVATGFNDDFGPFVIDEGAWSRIDDNPTAIWTVVPDTQRIDATNIGTIVDSWGGIRYDWRPTVDGMQTLSPQNRLVQTLRELDVRLAGLRAVEPVIFTLVVAVALVGLAELVRLLVSTRRRVTELYWARGDSRRGIAGRVGRDVALAGVLGGLAGAAVAGGAVIAIAGVDAVLGLGWVAAVPPLVTLVGALVVAVMSARPEPVSRERRRRGVRQARRLALPGIVVLLVLAAALSVWQLRLYGSPLTPTAEGTGDVDPIAVVAPALALTAAVLVCVVAFPRIAGLNERRVRRARLTSQLSARGIIRRAGLVLAPLVLVALAAGSTTVAAAYSATWDAAFDQTAALRAGSDLHANARIEGIGTQAQDAVRATSGVTAVAPVEVQPLTVGAESGTLVAATPEAVAELARAVPGTFHPVAAAKLLTTPVRGPVLPEGATGFVLTVEAKGFVAPPQLAVQLTDPLGFVRAVVLAPAAPAAEPDQLTYTATALPATSTGAWRVASIDVAFADQRFEVEAADLHILALDATDAAGTQSVPLEVFWIADSPGYPVSPPIIDGQGTGMFLADNTPFARLTPSLSGTGRDELSPPILVSQQLADRFDLEVGDPLAFNLQDGLDRLNCTVAGIIPAVPGSPTEAAALLDLNVVQHFQLRTTAVPADPRDLWITADDPPRVASDVRPALPANTRIDSASDPVGRQILGSAAIALWAAAACIVLLALAGIASSAGARLRTGRNDVAVLRALGLSVRDQGRIPAGELGVVLVIGGATGLLAGALVAALTIPYFARAAVATPYFSIETGLRFDPLWWAVLMAVLVAGSAAIVLGTARRVGRLVRTAVPGEGSE